MVLAASSSQAGKAIVELVLILTLLVLLPSTVFEYSRLYTTIQEISLLSREAANEIYRECVAAPQTAAGVPPGQTLGSCLGPQAGVGRQRATRFFSNARSLFSEGQFRIAIYELDALGSPQVLSEIAQPASFTTRVDITSPRFRQIVQDNGRVVVAEIAAPYDRLFNYSWTVPDEIYEATIF